MNALVLTSCATQSSGRIYADAASVSRFGPFLKHTRPSSSGVAGTFVGHTSDTRRIQVVEVLIDALPSLRVRVPIRARAVLESGVWNIEAVDLPLYGCGDSFQEARAMLQREIETLWDDLAAPGDYAKQWCHVIEYLRRVIDVDGPRAD